LPWYSDDVEHLGDVRSDHMHWSAEARGHRLSATSTTVSTRGRCGGKALLRRLAFAGQMLVGCQFGFDEALSLAQRLRNLFRRELQLIRVELLRKRHNSCASAP